MNLNDTKSSDELRLEISQDIDRLDRKVDGLKERLTPGQIIDDAVFSSYRGNPKGSYRFLKDNPVGTSFLAIGTILLMDNGGETYEQGLRTQSGELYRDYKVRADELKASARQTRNRLGEKVSDISGELRHKAQELASRGEEGINRAREKGKQLKDGIGQRFERGSRELEDNVIDATASFKERSEESLHSLNLDEIGANDLELTKKRVGERVGQVGSSVKNYGEKALGKIKEQNLDSLSYPALGMAAGIAIGGLIPLSDEEISFSSTMGDINLSELRRELEEATNESINIVKNEFIDTLKSSHLDIF